MASVAGLWSRAVRLCATVLLLDMALCKGFVEDLDESFKDNRKDDIWLVDFYAPWCGHCKKLEPVWNEVGLEMKIIGSPVKVGKMNATSYSRTGSCYVAQAGLKLVAILLPHLPEHWDDRRAPPCPAYNMYF